MKITKHQNILFREFHLRTMTFIIKSNTLDEASEFIAFLLIVAMSEFSGVDNDNVPLKSELCKRYLKEKISGLSIVEIN